MKGILGSLSARVIVFEQNGKKAMLVVTETGKGPTGWQFTQKLSEYTRLPPEAIFYTSTHTHTSPEMKVTVDFSNTDPAKLPGLEGKTEEQNLHKWARLVFKQMCDAYDEADRNLQPVTVSIGYGQSYINVNRNRFYLDESTGKSAIALGYNPEGPSDKTVAVIRFDSAVSGNPVAFIVNYAVHALMMYSRVIFDGKNSGVDGDLPAYVSRELEAKYPGSVVTWTSGAAGDQNPIVSNQMVSPNPKTGKMNYANGTDKQLLDLLGNIHFADVMDVLRNNMKNLESDSIGFAQGFTTIPNTDGSDFRLDLQVLRIGEMAFVGSPGELFTSLGMAMKKYSSLKDTVIFNHVWTNESEYSGYISDDEGVTNRAYGADRLAYKAGYIDAALITLENKLIGEASK
jgi:hypothetical protein